MVLVRVCDTCGMTNPPNELICQRCFSDISKKRATESKAAKTIHQPEMAGAQRKTPPRKVESPELDNNRTVREVTPLILVMSPGKMITVHHGETVGRELIGKRLFNDYNTVSRKHATFKYFNGRWLVKDESSTNGTYIGGKRISADKWYELKDGDSISFSSSCTFSIQG